MKNGPRDGLHFDNDNDFRNADIGINVNDNYMTLFLSMFSPQESGNFRFKCEVPDDYNAIWLDLDKNGIFFKGGTNGDEAILIRNGHTRNTVF